ncbi:hypothetical protein IPV09_06470 [Tessaracoccus sp. SD287]|uniref:SRPBCC family protein n=1 Tax=Tessaracoccus sp. SD287 TaxID=2782008 RepID=UPI001A9611A4|nr:hypothetical protein [Tessaracoccus sp. SD287]MBO1030979.1 hypothetical protein [Tessaracoccus sp. SD287]
MTQTKSRTPAALAIGAPLLAAAAAATAGAVAARRSGFPGRVGASKFEARTHMPGDDLLPAAEVQNDRARLLSAPPEQVWTWLSILGRDEAGLYSAAARQRLKQAEGEVAPLQVGERFWVHPKLVMRVVEVDPGRSLVLRTDPADKAAEPGAEVTWGLLLRHVPRPGRKVFTRLRIRERHLLHDAATSRRASAASVGTAVNTWRLLAHLESLTR